MSLTLMFSGMSMNPLLAMYLPGSSFYSIYINFSVLYSFSSLCRLVQYNFKGRYDLVRFIKTVQKVGLYAHLRIGPYVCAEWNFG